jgi:hypothetical protein
MTHRPWLTGLAAIVIVLGLARSVLANSISPYVWFWPGIVSITLVYAFPASLLAAFVERPFLTWAGFEQRALVLSLRANLLSTMVGILCIPVGYPALYIIGPFWCLVAFAISCVVEILYLRRFNRNLAMGRIIAGNAVSSGLLMALPPIAVTLRTNYYFLARSMEPHELWLGWTAAMVSLATFVSSFAFSVKPRLQAEVQDEGTGEHRCQEASGTVARENEIDESER